MKILFNCSVNVVGGAVQNAANFIKNAHFCVRNQYIFVVSLAVYEVLDRWQLIGDRVILVDSPSRSVKARRLVLKIEQEFRPDVVYTMAGPTYVNFKSYHVMGISDPYITHADFSSFIINRTIFKSFLFFLKELIKGVWARFEARYYLFQTHTSRDGFCKRFLLDKKRSGVVPNSVGENFLQCEYTHLESSARKIRVFVPSAYYPHKNLEIIFEICIGLKKLKLDERFVFVTTAPKGSEFSLKIGSLKLNSMINNIGPYSYADAVALYLESDICFIPSVLETFSTSYLEAIAVGMPLVVSDKKFSREICGEYAFFYSATSANDAIDALLQCQDAKIKGEKGVQRRKIVQRYGGQEQRFQKIISILEHLKKEQAD